MVLASGRGAAATHKQGARSGIRVLPLRTCDKSARATGRAQVPRPVAPRPSVRAAHRSGRMRSAGPPALYTHRPAAADVRRQPGRRPLFLAPTRWAGRR
eukprot:scaffold3394_cov385-Prasinococcus_capsulatus_cf.AAC.14